MSGIDWPLATLLAVMFVVMSWVRWRYFRSAARRWGRKGKQPRDLSRELPRDDS